jgi:fumarylacetoacetase
MAANDLQGLGAQPVEIARVNHKDDYWSMFQMLAYSSLSGCGLRTGDLISSGTISSPVRSIPINFNPTITNLNC